MTHIMKAVETGEKGGNPTGGGGVADLFGRNKTDP